MSNSLAIVTGTSSGIGAAVAGALLKKEWQVIGIARRGSVLRAENFRQLYVPIGFAHGFCVLSDHADVEYLCSDYYDPGGEAGLLWNDPDVAVQWPTRWPLLSEKDASNPVLSRVSHDVLP